MNQHPNNAVTVVAASFMLVVLLVSLFVALPTMEPERLLRVAIHVGPILFVSVILGACVRSIFFQSTAKSSEAVRTAIEDSTYWEAVTIYKDLPDGSSISLVRVAADGELVVIGGCDESIEIARQVLAHRENERKRWVQGGSHASQVPLHCSRATADQES